MNIGALDRRVRIQKPITTANDYGELVATYSVYATVWAAIERKPFAREAVSGEQNISFQSVTFIIRYSDDVSILTPSHQISYKGDIYNVLGVQEVGRNEQLRVVTELHLN
tara:strand:- start:12813 stop:13142 length:330 start_codon:yes stop_codon:yes gene_type:complete